MRVAAICDACHRPLMERTYAVQVQGADIYVTSSGVHTRTPDNLKAYNFCKECMATVRGAIDYVLHGPAQPVPAPTAPPPAPHAQPRRTYHGYDEVVRDPGEPAWQGFEG